MSATYWIIYPRNFANEFDVRRCEFKEDADTLASAGYTRITRRDAVNLVQRYGHTVKNFYSPARALTNPAFYERDRDAMHYVMDYSGHIRAEEIRAERARQESEREYYASIADLT